MMLHFRWNGIYDFKVAMVSGLLTCSGLLTDVLFDVRGQLEIAQNQQVGSANRWDFNNRSLYSLSIILSKNSALTVAQLNCQYSKEVVTLVLKCVLPNTLSKSTVIHCGADGTHQLLAP